MADRQAVDATRNETTIETTAITVRRRHHRHHVGASITAHMVARTTRRSMTTGPMSIGPMTIIEPNPEHAGLERAPQTPIPRDVAMLLKVITGTSASAVPSPAMSRPDQWPGSAGADGDGVVRGPAEAIPASDLSVVPGRSSSEKVGGESSWGGCSVSVMGVDGRGMRDGRPSIHGVVHRRGDALC